MKLLTQTCSIGCILVSLASSALAQEADDVPPVTDAPDGMFAVMRGVQGPAGMFAARLLLDFNMSADALGQPVSLAPDLFYSVTDKLQLGVLHSGPTGWQALPGSGLCMTGEDNGCAKTYDNIGFDLMVGLAFGDYHLSARSSLFINSFDPLAMSLALGFAGKAHFSPSVALFFDPKIAIAVNDREVNDDALFVPLELQFQVRPPTTLKLLSGIQGNLSAFGDTYQIPIGLGVVQNLTENVDLGARFSFDNLLGAHAEGVGAADVRSFAILLNLRS